MKIHMTRGIHTQSGSDFERSARRAIQLALNEPSEFYSMLILFMLSEQRRTPTDDIAEAISRFNCVNSFRSRRPEETEADRAETILASKNVDCGESAFHRRANGLGVRVCVGNIVVARSGKHPALGVHSGFGSARCVTPFTRRVENLVRTKISIKINFI